MKKAFILDISAFLHRGYYAFPDLKASDGTPTGAIYFFMTKFIDILQNFGKPDYIIAAIDSKAAKLKRNEIYPDYKSGRPQKHEDLKLQIEIFNHLATYLNIQHLEKPGYEADDVMGYCTKFFSEQNVESYMFTTDKDMAQLCTNDLVKQVIILTAAKSNGKGMEKYRVITKDTVKDFLGVEAQQVPDLFGIIGDKADAIPGINGIGEKGGVKLIEEYGFLENIYEHIDEIKGKTKEKLLTDKNNAFLSRELATIQTDFKIDIPIGKWKGFDYLNLRDLFMQLDMNKTLSLFDITTENLKDSKTNDSYTLIYKDDMSQYFIAKFYFTDCWKIQVFSAKPESYFTMEHYKDIDSILFETEACNLLQGINIFLKEMCINLKIYKMPFIYENKNVNELMQEMNRANQQLIIGKK